ncbi:MAG: hypothetical protein JO255_11360, partial [Alphaproteobacteria bacterium]|nr:hypothetical protein [Alphaproteobacteria bacterium]
MPKRNNAPIFWPLALLCLSVASCSAADTRSASAVLPAGARATSAVAVAGDSPAQFEAALRAAQRAGKTVRYVTVKSTRGADDYSVYAQIVRSEHALLVRAYGRMYVYPLTTAAVIYSASVQTVDISSIPIVDAPAIDAAFSSGTVLGVSATVRKKLCSNCAMVLVRPAHTTVDPTLWHSAKDTWQAHPDYAFWSPSSDSRPLTPDFIVGGGGGSGGCYEVIGSSVINVGPNPSGGCGPQYYYPVGRGGGGGGNPPPDIEETADAIDLLTPEQPGGDTVGFDFEQP